MSDARGRRILVLASLPDLPRFDRARALPIREATLAARLALLDRDDARSIDDAMRFLAWQRQPIERTDAELVAAYRGFVRKDIPRALRSLVGYRLELRTVIAALRRRRRGLPRPAPSEAWGVGPWVAHIERHYDAPTFDLRGPLPWVTRAAELIDRGATVELERMLFDRMWSVLARERANDPFGLAAVLAYLLQWDLVDRWLRMDAKIAEERLQALALAAQREATDALFA